MVGLIAVNYLLGWIVDRLRTTGWSSVAIVLAIAVNLGLLIAFKYANFLVDNLNVVLGFLGLPGVALAHVHLPLGISFFTFHALSYVIDIYRQSVRSERPIDFALYMTLFPHAIAGPIVRYGDIDAQLRERTITLDEFAMGVKRFIIGLSKKMLVANTLARAADAIFEIPPGELTTGLSWLGITCYTLQIYFDFSGYSDMAIGLAKLFGFDFRENFDYPYTARSVTDFWRRWHISLSTWFRDYLYIPLGGNRYGSMRLYLNLLIVFSLCGLWHGASWNFLAWGLFHGSFLVAERMGLQDLMKTLWRPLQHAYVMLVVMVGWVFFRATSFEEAALFLQALAGFAQSAGDQYHLGLYLDAELALALLAAVVGSTPFLPVLRRLRNSMVMSVDSRIRPWFDAGFAMSGMAAFSLLFLLSAMYLAAGTYNPFIYFRF
jgi:alginate O-acetyltransferase complex protein AlgI